MNIVDTSRHMTRRERKSHFKHEEFENAIHGPDKSHHEQ